LEKKPGGGGKRREQARVRDFKPAQGPYQGTSPIWEELCLTYEGEGEGEGGKAEKFRRGRNYDKEKKNQREGSVSTGVTKKGEK